MSDIKDKFKKYSQSPCVMLNVDYHFFSKGYEEGVNSKQKECDELRAHYEGLLGLDAEMRKKLHGVGDE